MYVAPLDDSQKRPRLPRTLDPVEIRILGSLAEKQLSTPEYYPLTLNALVAACNQKSNREPVMETGESEVQRALDRLQDEKLVWRVLGGRATRWEHNLDANLQLDRPAKAVLTLLFLRGPQTPGELRGRSDRLHAFETIQEVEDTLRHLDPIVRELPRRPGQKEARWYHTLSGAPPEANVVTALSASPGPREDTGQPLSERVQQLEEQVAQLTSELRDLRDKLGG
jgi:uncharacterized protein YceH (UPF0502 family)